MPARFFVDENDLALGKALAAIHQRNHEPHPRLTDVADLAKPKHHPPLILPNDRNPKTCHVEPPSPLSHVGCIDRQSVKPAPAKSPASGTLSSAALHQNSTTRRPTPSATATHHSKERLSRREGPFVPSRRARTSPRHDRRRLRGVETSASRRVIEGLATKSHGPRSVGSGHPEAPEDPVDARMCWVPSPGWQHGHAVKAHL